MVALETLDLAGAASGGDTAGVSCGCTGTPNSDTAGAGCGCSMAVDT